ncbi:MAG TPA: anti-sigma factor [Acidimicrobiia bacterium]
MIDHDSVVDLIPLLALDALEGYEMHRAQRHARACDQCRRELARYESVSAALASEGPAPRHVWDRIVAAIEDAFDDLSLSALEQSPRFARPTRGRFSWLTAVAAAVAIVFAGLAVAGWSQDPMADLGLVAARAANEPGSYVGDFIVDGESVASVVLTIEGRGFVVPGEALEPLGSDRAYQLWVMTPDERVISGGVLGKEPTVAAFTWSGPVSGFALTREVAGGVVESGGDLVAVATSQ